MQYPGSQDIRKVVKLGWEKNIQGKMIRSEIIENCWIKKKKNKV